MEIEVDCTNTLKSDSILENLVRSSTVAGSNKEKSLAGSVLANNNSKKSTKWDKLLSFQEEWKIKFKNGVKIFFDNNSLASKNRNLVQQLNKKGAYFQKKFRLLGANVVPYLEENVEVVISERSSSNITNFRAHMKVWDYNKLERFFQNLDTDLTHLIENSDETFDFIEYFETSPHIYMFDTLQRYRPLICRKWEVSFLNKSKVPPYPTLKHGTYGRCPFIGDMSVNENAPERITKRYNRDKSNENLALRLRKIFSKSAKPDINRINSPKLIIIPNNHLNSKISFNDLDKMILKRANTVEIQYKSFTEGFDNPLAQNNQIDESLSSMDTIDTEETIPTLDISYQPRSDLKSVDERASQDNSALADENLANNSKIFLEKANIKMCENCQIRFDKIHFNSHVASQTHQEFSSNDSNFIEIDSLISKIKNK
ncbi:hypothetical protein KAFR_0C00330 [Kazachstania africana CBS 2517]|uniref:DBF4-type domain-containing protein n=1 Tax=Kazachstania africana (strain ATCC 22294 / BCRC 22015 / CBS 2517 / CECT 1963 / NBRC 1671 / NRRL Y-8276) TaxID=1071382 RepID=H2ARM9_KAZAF|nr:hypothetical protein KAFR_0C00330 [Kazachstania africana CBS 2517]CCF57029.1 hypothetical protein KAFR_0C00330 [Kazachstania africana CBS 2517]